MKTRLSILPAMLLALFVAGCKEPTDPAFAPDGRTLVFAKDGSLFLRSSQGDRKISEDVEGPVSWSPDGSKVAFSRNNGTTIYDVATGKSVGSSKYTYPYAWQNGMLAGVRAFGDQKDATIFTVSPDSAEPHLEVNVPFHPDRIDVLTPDLVLIWNGPLAYTFDGLGCTEAPHLRGLKAMVPQKRNGEWLLAKAYARPHTHSQVLGFYKWSGDPGANPDLLGTIDIAAQAGLGDRATMIQDFKMAERGERMVATILTLHGTATGDRTFTGLVDKYDLLNHFDKEPDMSDRDAKRFKEGERMSLVRIVFTGTREGRWVELDRVVEPPRPKKEDTKSMHIRLAPDLRIGINGDGTLIAVSGEKGTKTYKFPGP